MCAPREKSYDARVVAWSFLQFSIQPHSEYHSMDSLTRRTLTHWLRWENGISRDIARRIVVKTTPTEWGRTVGTHISIPCGLDTFDLMCKLKTFDAVSDLFRRDT